MCEESESHPTTTTKKITKLTLNFQKWTTHTKSTITLCLCLLSHSYLLISIFPYAGFMALHLLRHDSKMESTLNEENIGPYAGLLSSSFMIGRASSSFLWGRAADTYGRKSILMITLASSGFISLLFGLSLSWKWALIFRFSLGFCNGIVSTTQTLVSELAGGDLELEAKDMGLVIGMWGWGFLVSPSISSALAEPLRQYPELGLVEAFRPILERFPFLLPNLVGTLLCGLCLMAVNENIEETLPDDKRRDWNLVLQDICSWAKNVVTDKLLCCSKENTGPVTSGEALPLIHRAPNSLNTLPQTGKTSESDLEYTQSNTNLPRTRTTTTSKPSLITAASSIWSRTPTRRCLILICFFFFGTVAVDEAFPLFCMSNNSGLGLTELGIGRILSVSGLIFVLCQYTTHSKILDRCGLIGTIHISSWMCLPFISLIPCSLLLLSSSSRYTNNGEHGNDYDQETTRRLNTSAFLLLSVCMGLVKVMSTIYFSGVSVAANRTISISERATMNGVLMLGGSVSKALSPIFTGYLVAFSFSVWEGTLGAVVVFGVIGGVMMTTAILTCLFLNESVLEQEEEEHQGS